MIIMLFLFWRSLKIILFKVLIASFWIHIMFTLICSINKYGMQVHYIMVQWFLCDFQNNLMCNHLPKDDLVDFTTYLKYHSLLTLTTDQCVGQLVVWKEVYPTRLCQSVPEEQQFGYTEPLIARWFWLIVGYVSSKQISKTVYNCY